MTDKKEVLKKVTNKKHRDERQRQIEINGFKAGWMASAIALLGLIALRWSFKEPVTDIVLIFLAQQFAAFTYQYFKLKEKKYLYYSLVSFGGILMGLAALFSQYGIL